MNEIVILMAAGLGIRMKPLTDEIPKPLINVHGKPMIETVIDGLQERGVEKFIVVVGYKGEQFEYLTEKYDNLILVVNKDYAVVNNISSIYTVSDILSDTDSNCFICEADLYISDKSIFDAALNHSCYYGKMVEGHSDDWVFNLDKYGKIIKIGKGGDNCYNMVGIAYFKKEDAHKLGNMIKNIYGTKGYEKLFWDEVVDKNLNELDLTVHEIKEGQIIEIDTLQELMAVDLKYKRFS